MSCIFTTSAPVILGCLVRARASRIVLQELLLILMVILEFQVKMLVMVLWQSLLSGGLWRLRIVLLVIAIWGHHIFLLGMENQSLYWFIDLFGRVSGLLLVVIINLWRTLLLDNRRLQFL